jgi:hypothetical protein
MSVSDWVEDNIKKTLGNDYPNDFFELFGAINDDTFIEPVKTDQKYDSKENSHNAFSGYQYLHLLFTGII